MRIHLLADPKARCECQNCDWQGVADDLDAIADFDERVAPGEICPAGECPKCGALAHLVTDSGLPIAKIAAPVAVRS